MTKHLPGDLTPFIRKNRLPFKAAYRALPVEDPIRPRALQRFIGNYQKVFRRWLLANTVVGAVLLTGLIALAWIGPSDQSGATAQSATMHTQAKLAPEPASVLPSR
jgi:hypothetical protein